jgi:thiamine-monophosphate kinase
VEPAAVAFRGRERALEMALHGGEEYQLLFAVPPRKLSLLRKLPGRSRITRIGVLTRGRGDLILEREEGKPVRLEPGGYDHLRPSSRRRPVP